MYTPRLRWENVCGEILVRLISHCKLPTGEVKVRYVLEYTTYP